MILIEGLGPLSEDAAALPERIVRYLRHHMRTSQAPTATSVQSMVERMMGAIPGLSESSALRLVHRGAKELPEGGYTWRADRRLRAPSLARLTEAQVLALLSQLSAPTLLIWAQDGYPFDASLMTTRCASIANLHISRLPGRHHLHMDEAERVADAIRLFWADSGFAV